MKKGTETKENILFRILSIILINVILISLFAPYSTVFADSNMSVRIESDATELKVGDIVEVKIYVENESQAGFSGYFSYDTNVFETINKKNIALSNELDNGTYGDWAIDFNASNNNYIRITESHGEKNEIPGGHIATISLTVKKETNTTDISFTTIEIDGETDIDGDSGYHEIPEIKTTLPKQVTKHTVTYDYTTNGGESSTLDNAKVGENSAIDLSAIATKTGYNFVGWNTDPNAKTGLESLDMSTSDVTLYAIFSKDITTTFKYYNGTTEKQEDVVSTMYNNDENVTIKTPIGKTYTDGEGNTWTKNGWTTSTTSTTTAGTLENTDIKVNSNNTYYMLYKRNITLNYNVNGGSSIAPTSGIGVVATNTSDITSILGADMVIDSSTPIKVGYTFSGWNTKQDGTGNNLTGTQKLTKDTTLYAKWTPNTNTKYTVEHYKEQLEGSYVKADTDNLTGTTDTQINAQSKTNYTGYNLDTNVAGTVTTGTIKGDGSLVLKLYYKLNEYTVTFKNDKGTIINTQKVKFGGNAILPSNPTKDKDEQYTYTFEKWVDSSGADIDLTNITSDMEAFASYTKEKNKYTITFYDEDGTTKLGESTVDYGENATAPETPTKVEDNTYTYAFEKWVTEKGGNTEDNLSNVTANRNVYAKYTSTYKKYSVQFLNDNGAEISNKTDYHYGDSIVLPQNPTKDKTDEQTYIFAGWSEDGKNVIDLTGVTVSENKIYKAVYKAETNKYTVTFYDEDGTTKLGESTVDYGEMAIAPTANKEEDNTYTYTFEKWVTEKDGNIEDNLSNVTANRNVYAKYTSTYKNYSVEFVDENGVTISKKDDYHYGDKITLPNNPTKDANEEYTYTFEGWTSGSEDVVDLENKTVSENVKYTAKYSKTKNKYTVTFYDEDKITKLGESTVDYGAEATTTNPTKEDKNGYTYLFEKWTSETGEEDDLSNVIANRNVYAKYTKSPIIYTIEYIDTFGSDNSKNPTTYTVEDADITLQPLEDKTGMTFKGWYTSNTYETKIESIRTSQLGNIKIYAKWDIEKLMYFVKESAEIDNENEEVKIYDNFDEAKEYVDNLFNNGNGTALGIYDLNNDLVYYPELEQKQYYITDENGNKVNREYDDFEEARNYVDTEFANGTKYKIYDKNDKLVYEPKEENKKIQYFVKVNKDDENTSENTFTNFNDAKVKADEIAETGAKIYDANGDVVYEPEGLYLKSKVYKIGTNNTDEKLDEYVDGDLYLYRVSSKTTLKDFIYNCDTNGIITVYKPNGTILKENEFVGTGMILKDRKGSKEISIKISVIGDIDGNGEVTPTDLAETIQKALGNDNLNEIQTLSVDIDENKEITPTDLAEMIKLTLE